MAKGVPIKLTVSAVTVYGPGEEPMVNLIVYGPADTLGSEIVMPERMAQALAIVAGDTLLIVNHGVNNRG